MDEDESLPLSAIEHYAYCPRQAALIHVEGVWEANVHTAQGDADHAAVDRATRPVTRGSVTTWTSLPVWHDDLRLYGVCDTVEVTDDAVLPIEHKPTLSRWRRAPSAQQLAAQAMCLEQMWQRPVVSGVIFTRRDHRRHVIDLDDDLRAATLRTIEALQKMIDRQLLPRPVRDGRCDRCSLRPTCIDDDANVAPIFAPAPEGRW